MEKKSRWYHSPFGKEVSNQKLVRDSRPAVLNDEIYPSTFEFDVDTTEGLEDGAVIGRSAFGQVLIWLNNQVVSKG